MTMKSNPIFTSTELFTRINKHWLFLLLSGLAGAVISLVISLFFIQPTYISTAQISVGINFKEIGHISQYEQDQYIGLVEALFLSDAVVQNTLDALALQNIHLTKQAFIDHRLVERKSNLIILKYAAKDENIPQIIASTWNKNAFQALSNAYQHAINYQNLINLQNAYLSCYQNAVEYPAAANCSQLLSQLPDTHSVLEEKRLSQGLFPGLTFYFLDEEASAPQVIRHQTNVLVLAGFFAGLFIAIIVLLFVKRLPFPNENITP